MQLICKSRRTLSRLKQVILRHGPLCTLKLLLEELIITFDVEWLRRWRDSRFDQRHRVETIGFRTLQQLGIGEEQAAESHNYRGTPETLFDTAFGSLSIAWEHFEFVDYGSGLGKALLLAARYPFRRITGVEFSAELHETAEHNIAKWFLPRQRCKSVRCVLADASEWSLPEGDCLLYFFNPFREALLRKVLHRIVIEAARKHGDTIYIVYIHPSFPEVFDEFQELTLIERVGVLRSLYDIYTVKTPRSLLWHDSSSPVPKHAAVKANSSH